MPFPRMTTRRWMIAVGVTGAILGSARAIEIARARRSQYELCAALHAWAEDLHAHAERYEGACLGWAAPPFRANPQIDPVLVAYHARMKRKYQSASRRSWLPVPPDPRPPESPGVDRRGGRG